MEGAPSSQSLPFTDDAGEQSGAPVKVGSRAVPVQVLAVEEAYPDHDVDQETVIELCRDVFSRDQELFERLTEAYANAGVKTRHSCMPPDWYREERGWAERTAQYQDHALTLLQKVTEGLLRQTGLETDQIDAILCVSTTGIATPSLDSLLINEMGFRNDISRLPIFGLGCAGGAVGLARAADFARLKPGSNVLLLVVELCSLNFRPQDGSKKNIIGSALFGDGAAGVILNTERKALRDDMGDDASSHASLLEGGEYQWPGTGDIMGWSVEEDGFGLLLSRNLPVFVRREFPDVATGFLAKHGLTLQDLDGIIAHPGGAKVLNAIDACLDVPTAWLDNSRAVLAAHGNMSAVTILVVLKRALEQGETGTQLMVAFGPGFSAGLLLADLQAGPQA